MGREGSQVNVKCLGFQRRDRQVRGDGLGPCCCEVEAGQGSDLWRGSVEVSAPHQDSRGARCLFGVGLDNQSWRS